MFKIKFSPLDRILDKTWFIVANLADAIKSMFYRRDKSVILFGAWFGDKFADNSRFLFQYLSENKESLGLTHVVWVTRSESVKLKIEKLGYEVYNIGSDESTKYHKLAGMHVVCNGASLRKGGRPDIDIRWSYGSKRVNLWHGVGAVKGVSNDSLEYKKRKDNAKLLYSTKEFFVRLIPYRLFCQERGGWGDFYFLSPTASTTTQFSRFRYIPSQKFIQAAYPRTCPCIKLLDEEADLIDKMQKYDYTVLYLPTFREYDESNSEWFNLANNLSPYLEKYNVLWIDKSHSVSHLFDNASSSKHIVRLDSNFDINVLMPKIDLLITDYSSAASDARFFRKPIFFFLPDYDKYCSSNNGITIEAEELLYGPKYYNLKDFINGFDDFFNHYIYFKPDSEYERIREKYWGSSMDITQIWEQICKQTNY